MNTRTRFTTPRPNVVLFGVEGPSIARVTGVPDVCGSRSRWSVRRRLRREYGRGELAAPASGIGSDRLSLVAFGTILFVFMTA